MNLRFLLLIAFAMSVSAGCDRNMEPYVAGEKPRESDLSKIFPAGAEPDPVVAKAPPSPMGARREPPIPAAAAGGASIRGTVTVTEELAAAVPASAVLFISARRAAAGPPTAVVRIASPRFPLEFEIGPADRMTTAVPFTGPFALTARVDADGNAISRQPGDLEAGTPITVDNGAKSAVLVIDERI